MTLRRRWQIAAVGLLVLLLAVPTVLWFGNTESLDFPFSVPGAPVRPGVSVAVDMGDRVCAPNIEIVYRPSRLGRWQETHVNGRTDFRRWWETSNREYFKNLDCAIGGEGEWIVTVPADVTSNRIAICGLDNDCVEIAIDQAD